MYDDHDHHHYNDHVLILIEYTNEWMDECIETIAQTTPDQVATFYYDAIEILMMY